MQQKLQNCNLNKHDLLIIINLYIFASSLKKRNKKKFV